MKISSQHHIISGSAGEIEVTLDLPAVETHQNYLAINCHPHSLHGGSMTNKVIHTVSKAVAGLGIPSARFNFRGVGKTQGEFDHGIGEQEDLRKVAEWMSATYPNRQLILSGFSFGAFVSAMAAKALSPALLISVAPPIARFDFQQFSRPNAQWAVIIGDADELVDFAEVQQWINTFDDKPAFIAMDGASHFFHGRLVELREHVESIVKTHIT